MPQVGGVARRAAVIARERTRDEAVLVVDAGNSLIGDQDPALKTEGQSSIDALNRMGYDAIALGPKDLTLGSATLRRRIAEARFAILSANAVVSSTGQLIARPFVVREIGDQRVALVGLSGVVEGVSADVRTDDPMAAARAIIPQAAAQAGIVVLLSNAGLDANKQIADSVPGITVIVSGGSGTMTQAWQSPNTGALVLHADEASIGHAGRILGLAALTFGTGGKLTGHDWQQVSLAPEIGEDPEMAAWVVEQTKR